MAPRILIVEDDRDTREMLGHLLELEGFDVQTAANGRQALDQLRGEGTANVILLDLMMPVMDGWQFRAEQRRDPRLSGIPVVVVTAAGARDAIPAIDADAWVPKPIDFDRLIDTITPLCGHA